MILPLKIVIKTKDKRKEVDHLKANKTRVLVGILINPYHLVIPLDDSYAKKIIDYIIKLEMSSLHLRDIIFRYQKY